MGSIAVITSEFLRRPTEAAIRRLRPEMETMMPAYNSFAHLPGLYGGYAPEADSVSVFTTVQEVRLLTGGGRNDGLGASLAQCLDFPAAVGYGVGEASIWPCAMPGLPAGRRS